MRDSCERGAFTLIELLVTTGVLAMLIAILLPSLSSARAQARRTACGSNLREVARANAYYADDAGVFVPGASEFIANLQRWHGARDGVGVPFDPARGPMSPYLGPQGLVNDCPSFPADEIARASGGFERGNGGYGYNNRFIGVQLARLTREAYVVTTDRAGAYPSDVNRPPETIMFTDAAFADRTPIEYSFAEPRFHPQFPGTRAVPSIHFRHRGRANVVWCDGHVDARVMTFSDNSPFYPADPVDFAIGWFGAVDDNSLFDLD